MSKKATSFEELAKQLGVRRIHVVAEELLTEAGTKLETPLKQAAAVAIVKNPWLNAGTDSDLAPATEKLAPVVAKLLADRLLDILGGAENIEVFGKASLVGEAGELEHAGALIHTPYFGNIIRELLGGTSVLCFADGRGAAGQNIAVPMWHKTHATSRKHYQSINVHLGDGPQPDEICIIAAAATGARPFARIGDRQTDTVVTAEILKGLI